MSGDSGPNDDVSGYQDVGMGFVGYVPRQPWYGTEPTLNTTLCRRS
jgi:hypothetical protein